MDSRRISSDSRTKRIARRKDNMETGNNASANKARDILEKEVPLRPIQQDSSICTCFLRKTSGTNAGWTPVGNSLQTLNHSGKPVASLNERRYVCSDEASNSSAWNSTVALLCIATSNSPVRSAVDNSLIERYKTKTALFFLLFLHYLLSYL